jgi:hypothetical protein
VAGQAVRAVKFGHFWLSTATARPDLEKRAAVESANVLATRRC